MKNRNEIPSHSKCNNCGGCCGPIWVTTDELEEIRRFVNKMSPKYKKELLEQRKTKDSFTCQFRDEKSKKCAIYHVRPAICRLMGVTEGMSCPQGNSHEIDGKEFLDFTKPPILLPDMLS